MLRIGIGLGVIPTAARPAPTTAPVNVVKPFFEGILTQGQSANVNPGSWIGLPGPNFAYAIKRGATTVSTDPDYLWQAADVAAGAAAMTVVVTATNDVGSTPATSDPVTIAAPLQISGTPGEATVGTPYSFTPAVSGGHGRTFSLTGVLPAGFTFSAVTGEIAGTALSTGAAEDLAITVTDDDGLTATLGPFDLVVTAGDELTLATQVSQYGVTYKFSSACPVGQYANGDWWVQSPVTITEITPASALIASGTYSNGTPWTNRKVNGAMLNPGNRALVGGTTAANDFGSLQGFDSIDGSSQPLDYDNSLNIDPGNTGSSLVFEGGEEGSVVKSTYAPSPNATGRAVIMDMVVLTVVAAIPESGDFRPPVATASKASLWNEADLNYGVFQNLATVTGAPTLATAAGYVDRMIQVGYTNNLGSRNISAVNNHQEYGRDIADDLNEACLALHLNYSNAEKRDLLVGVVQTGIDVYGRVTEGGVFYDLGGGNNGKKAVMLAAGLALGDVNILAWANKATHNVFMEDRQVFQVEQADVDRVRYTGDARQRDPYTVPMIATPEWGEQHLRQPARDGSNWNVNYRTIAGCNAITAALFARLCTGGLAAWNYQAFFDYYDRYYSREKNNVGGTSQISTFTSNMWIAYRGAADVSAPALSTAKANSDKLWLTYGELLNETVVPATSAYTVTQNGSPVTVSAVKIIGAAVELSLGTALTNGSTLLISATAGAVKDLAGNNAAALSGQAVTNLTAAPPTAPVNVTAPALIAAGGEIEDTPYAGQQLSVSNGLWSQAPTSYAQSIERSDNGTTGWTTVAGPTASVTYTPTTAEVGKYFRAKVTATNGIGSTTATGAASAPLSEVAPSAFPRSTFGPTTSLVDSVSRALAATDGKTGTLALRIKRAAPPSSLVSLLSGNRGRVLVQILTTGVLRVSLSNSGGTDVGRLDTVGTVCDGNIHEILMSWDLSLAAASGRQVYLDGAPSVAGSTWTNANIGYTSSATSTFGGTGSNRLDGDFEMFWLDPTTRIDLSVSGNRDKFKAENIGLAGDGPTGAIPAIFLVGPASDINAGQAQRGSVGTYPKSGPDVVAANDATWP